MNSWSVSQSSRASCTEVQLINKVIVYHVFTIWYVCLNHSMLFSHSPPWVHSWLLFCPLICPSSDTPSPFAKTAWARWQVGVPDGLTIPLGSSSLYILHCLHLSSCHHAQPATLLGTPPLALKPVQPQYVKGMMNFSLLYWPTVYHGARARDFCRFWLRGYVLQYLY